jgi:hypothetical protein
VLSQVKQDEVFAFLDQAAHMSVDQFQIVLDAERGLTPISESARPLLKLGAADGSWLRKKARDAVRPLLRSLDWPNDGLAVAAIYMTIDAANAIVRRDRLSLEQYEAFVGGYRKAGVCLPPHPSQQPDAS